MEDFTYDIYGMRAAEMEAAGILRRIRFWLNMLEETAEPEMYSSVEDLRRVCRGYERILLTMDAAARAYGAAAAEAEELAGNP